MSDNMLNLDGWVRVDCAASDRIQGAIVAHHEATGEGVVLSSLTDPDGERSGMKVIYTEWGRNGVAELRTYSWRGVRHIDRPGLHCEHYVPTEATP